NTLPQFPPAQESCMQGLRNCIMVSPELQVWLKEHSPETAAEAAALADVFVAARKKNQPWSYTAWKTTKDSRKSTAPQTHQRQVTSVGKSPTRETEPAKLFSKPYGKLPVCYLCGQEGHTKPVCPKNPVKLTQMCLVPRYTVEPRTEGTVEGLIDTGSDQTLVHSKMLPPNMVCVKETVHICCVHGDEKPYPTADVYLKVHGQVYLLNVGVVKNLPFSVVFGRDLPVLLDFLYLTQKCCVAMTRAQSKKSDQLLETLSALPFFDADLEAAPGKSRKSRRERRQEKFQRTVVKPAIDPVPEVQVDFKVPTNITSLQQNDPALSPLLQKAKERKKGTVADCNLEEEFYLHNGVLYGQQGAASQLVVPQAAREGVLTLGHSVPWAGNLGKHKTTARIKRQFNWPGMHTDVAQFFKSCPQCQRTSSNTPSRAPLQPLPIISTSFERLGMDIVGSVENTRCCKLFCLGLRAAQAGVTAYLFIEIVLYFHECLVFHCCFATLLVCQTSCFIASRPV
ncbi:hypothetical protein Q8A73_006227, partial [Channa argus]